MSLNLSTFQKTLKFCYIDQIFFLYFNGKLLEPKRTRSHGGGSSLDYLIRSSLRLNDRMICLFSRPYLIQITLS